MLKVPVFQRNLVSLGSRQNHRKKLLYGTSSGGQCDLNKYSRTHIIFWVLVMEYLFNLVACICNFRRRGGIIQWLRECTTLFFYNPIPAPPSPFPSPGFPSIFSPLFLLLTLPFSFPLSSSSHSYYPFLHSSLFSFLPPLLPFWILPPSPFRLSVTLLILLLLSNERISFLFSSSFFPLSYPLPPLLPPSPPPFSLLFPLPLLFCKPLSLLPLLPCFPLSPSSLCFLLPAFSLPFAYPSFLDLLFISKSVRKFRLSGQPLVQLI